MVLCNTFKKLRSQNFGSFSLCGHSKAAEQTYFYIKELKWMFDIGEKAHFKPRHVFITHCHTDHCQMVHHALTNRFQVHIYIPQESASHLETFLKALHQLNSCSLLESKCNYHLHRITPGDEIEIDNGKFIMKAVKCFHSVPTVGYCFDQVSNKLKSEYFGLEGKKIGQLRKQGHQVTEKIRKPFFVFLGDTTSEIFDSSPHIFDYPVIVVECTFLEDHHEDTALEKQHMHWSELRPFVSTHPDTTFVLIHFSLRHTDEFIENFFQREENNFKNVVVWTDDYAKTK
eukprot:gb/GECH01007525.1/.p1 GENE.gb/GECH01007525.1/~~gb/GECH01007525.1/.p1  ORF type:complete len:286 (+),score=67.14 gb/GECH01007525.1/:1-858(+)